LDPEIRGEDRLLALEEFCPALQRCDLEGASVADVVFVLTEIFRRENEVCCSRRFLSEPCATRMAIVECVHLQRDLILRILQVLPRTGDLRSRDAIFLGGYATTASGAGRSWLPLEMKVFLPCGSVVLTLGMGVPVAVPKAPGGIERFCSFADMQRVGLICYDWKNSLSGRPLSVFVFLDFVSARS